MSILDEMKVRRLYCDGGMGSLLQAAGLAAGELPERWNISHPEVITDVHRKYLAAGADIMTTNTFGANRLKYDKDGELKAIVEAAIANARKAVEEAGRGYVALDLGPTGKLLKPLGDLPFETAVSLYKEVVSIGAAAGADLVLIETMSDSYETKAAVLAAKEGCTCRLEQDRIHRNLRLNTCRLRLHDLCASHLQPFLCDKGIQCHIL